MRRFLKWVVSIIVALTSIAGIAALAVWFSSSSDTRATTMQTFFGPFSDGRDVSWHTPGGDELLRAMTDHYLIALPISRCFEGVNLYWGEDGPGPRLTTTFMLNTQPNGEMFFGTESPATSGSATSTNPNAPIPLTNLQRAVLTISRSASLAREDFANSAAHSRSDMLLYQWMIVIVGALTTILVSIKSMANGTTNTGAYFVIGILAVVFSACGTALASMNSFLSPNDAYVRAERALLQVRQIHLELALQVAQSTDLCTGFDQSKTDDPRAKQLSDLATRLKEVVTSSGFSSGASSSTSANSGSSSASSPNPFH